MNKTRYDLLPSYGITEVSKVLTNKLDKYKKNEWKFGIPWTEVLSSLKKHLTEFELGNDFTEDKMFSIAEVAANALILCDYYHIYPQGDDRIIRIHRPITGCDIDGCILDFDSAFKEKYGVTLNPYWNGNYKMNDYLKELESDKEFWLNMKVLHRPTFEIDYYITSRSIPKEWIEESLQKNGLPCAPVYTVPWNQSKLPILQKLGIEIFIDDKITNFREANDNGIFCYLMDAYHNQYYDVGHRRIYDLNLKLK